MEGRQAAMGRRFVNDKSLAATERYLKIAEEAGLHPVTMATAWSKQHDFVASTIVGVSAYEQLDPILDAMELVLEDGVMKALHKVSKRSEERRVGKEWVSTCRSRWSPYH